MLRQAQACYLMKTPKNKTNIALTCVGGKFIYDFIACLRATQNLDVTITGIDAREDAGGQLLCDSFYTAPFAGSDPEGFINRLSDIIKKNHIDIFIPSSDEEVEIVANHFDHFTKTLGVQISFGNPATARDVTNKHTLMSSLQKSGVQTGAFYLIQNEADVEQSLNALGYPHKKIIAKPCRSRGSRGVFLFNSDQAVFHGFLEHRFCGTGNLEVFYQEMQTRKLPIKDLVMMPYYDGLCYDVDIVAKKGVLQDICIRLRQLKNTFSPTSTGHKICMKPEIISFAEKACLALQADGVFDLDVMEDQNGALFAIDASCRFSGSVGASRVAGHNMPGQLIRTLLDLPLEKLSVQDHTVLRPFWTMQSIDLQRENILL